ncbi:EAL domain-containing protein, partial [Vibrio parahaemolyticus]|nr:EAL domain-containing protein [Vibrio parahaemolyticus]
CQTAKLEVIAEGVESWEQYIKLKELGVRFFQGYLFSKPHIAPQM